MNSVIIQINFYKNTIEQLKLRQLYSHDRKYKDPKDRNSF